MVSVNLTLLSATISFLLRTHLSAEKTGNTKRYLRLKFDGGSRGINALGSGGAILHECFSSITDGFNAVAATNLNKGVLVSEEPDDLIMPRYPTNTSVLNRPCSAQFVEETADSTIEVELWRGSFFFGDGISSHVAEYLSLIEGLYAVRSAIRLGMGSLIEGARNHEMFGLVDSLISPGCTTDNYDRNIEDTRTQRSDDINGKQEVLDISNYSILIQGDSEILVKNLVNGYEPRNKDLRSPHILAASLLKSLTKIDVKGEELHRLQHSAYSLRHIPRKKNILADALATQGIFSRKTRSIIPIEYESPFSSTKIEMNQNHEDLQINRKAVVTESERDMYSVDPVISHDDYEGNKRNLIAKTVEENYGGMYFIKILSSKVPKHCQSHFLGYALSCSVGDISMNIPVTFDSNTKMKRTFLGVKTFQKKIQNPNIRVTGTPSDEKDGGDESDIDNIVCIDNFQFSNEFNTEKVTLKLSKIKNVNLNLNSSTEQIGTRSDLDDCAVEIAEDDEMSSSVSINGDLRIETIGGGTVQFCVELGPRIDHFDTKKEDLKRDSASEEGECKGEYYNDDVRNRRQRQGEKSDSDSHHCDLLHRQYYISLPLPAPQSPPLVPTYPRDALTLNPSHLSSIVLDNSTAHPYKPQNNYTESAGIEIQGPELNDPRDVLHLEVQLNYHDISSLSGPSCLIPYLCGGVYPEVENSAYMLQEILLALSRRNLLEKIMNTQIDEKNGLHPLELALLEGKSRAFKQLLLFGGNWVDMRKNRNVRNIKNVRNVSAECSSASSRGEYSGNILHAAVLGDQISSLCYLIKWVTTCGNDIPTDGVKAIKSPRSECSLLTYLLEGTDLEGRTPVELALIKNKAMHKELLKYF